MVPSGKGMWSQEPSHLVEMIDYLIHIQWNNRGGAEEGSCKGARQPRQNVLRLTKSKVSIINFGLKFGE